MNNLKGMKKYIMITIMLLAGMNGISQMVPDGIVKAFEKGDSKSLVKYFNDNIEMRILDEEYVTSRNQATRIMQEFFKEYQPVSFKVEYQGTKQDVNYGLGKLMTRKGNFSVNLYFMKGTREKIIYSISIEKT